MIGSIPMSLAELPMAPALISALIKQKGHDFEFCDINLEFYNHCNRDPVVYQETVELLQSFHELESNHIIDQWLNYVLEVIGTRDILLVNVFSHLSQSTALRIIQLVRDRYPHIKIFAGGIGSQKYISNADNKHVRAWIEKRFPLHTDLTFGALLLENNLIDSWQQDTDTTEINQLIPNRIVNLREQYTDSIDFSIFKIDEYVWEGPRFVPVLGSHGCVRQCSFCDVIKHFPSYRFVEADDLTKQIVKIYQQTGVGRVAFMDSLVNGSMKNFESLLENLAHSRSQGWLPPDFAWTGSYICRPPSTQLNRIHELMPAAGTDMLVVGVETGSDRVRFDMDKKFTNRDLLDEMSALARHGVKSRQQYFPAWPTETEDDFAQTLELFQAQAEYAQRGTLDTVSLGSTGFSLIDGTPIDRDRGRIGLEAGPLPFLWKCTTNPGLTFWEVLRRRLLMADICGHHGIRVMEEAAFVRFLAYNLDHYTDIVQDYVGPLYIDLLDHSATLSKQNNQHCLSITVVNGSDQPVDIAFNGKHYNCDPGIHRVSWQFVKPWYQAEQYRLSVKFGNRHRVQWAQHPNGDYYNPQGVYLDQITVDYKNITEWGFDQITEQHLIEKTDLPSDYYQHLNRRCVTQDTDLIWNIPDRIGMQAHILRKTNPAPWQDIDSVKQRLCGVLEQHR